MARQRATSTASTNSSRTARDQELGSMYDYLAKVILIGPSGCGKSCLLHRFVKNEWRVLSSQTIGVEFASRIVKIGTGSRRKRIKLQLWDTAGTERFRSVSRSYYRGAAGAILVYDISSHNSFTALPTFLNDARALASPNLTVLLAGNKADLEEPADLIDTADSNTTPLSPTTATSEGGNTTRPPTRQSLGVGSQNTMTVAPEGREVSTETATKWASSQSVGIPVAVEVSAFSGDGVEELFAKLARTILAKIEIGEIDPDDPNSGIQYGDSGSWGYAEDGGSIKSGDDGSLRMRRGRRRGWGGGMQEWEEVFRLGPGRRRLCC